MKLHFDTDWWTFALGVAVDTDWGKKIPSSLTVFVGPFAVILERKL